MPRGVYVKTEAHISAIRDTMAAKSARGELGTICLSTCSCDRHAPPPPSAETIRRRALSLQGHTVSQETRQKISQALLGRHPTEEQLAARKLIIYPPRTDEQQHAKPWRNGQCLGPQRPRRATQEADR